MLLTSKLERKTLNGRDIYLHINKKQNGYQNVNEISFFICGSELLNVLILVAETSISDVYCSSSDL